MAGNESVVLSEEQFRKALARMEPITKQKTIQTFLSYGGGWSTDHQLSYSKDNYVEFLPCFCLAAAANSLDCYFNFASVDFIGKPGVLKKLKYINAMKYYYTIIANCHQVLACLCSTIDQTECNFIKDKTEPDKALENLKARHQHSPDHTMCNVLNAVLKIIISNTNVANITKKLNDIARFNDCIWDLGSFDQEEMLKMLILRLLDSLMESVQNIVDSLLA